MSLVHVSDNSCNRPLNSTFGNLESIHNKTNHFLVSLRISVTIKLIADPFEFTYPSRYLSKTITHHYLLSLKFQIPPVIFTLAVSAVHSITSFMQLKYFITHKLHKRWNTCCTYDVQTARCPLAMLRYEVPKMQLVAKQLSVTQQVNKEAEYRSDSENTLYKYYLNIQAHYTESKTYF